MPKALETDKREDKESCKFPSLTTSLAQRPRRLNRRSGKPAFAAGVISPATPKTMRANGRNIRFNIFKSL